MRKKSVGVARPKSRDPHPERARPALDARVRERFTVSWGKARGFIETGKITVDGEVVTDTRANVGDDAVIELRMNAPRPKSEGALDDSRIVHVDAHVVVVRKPAGISTIPFDENETGTLDELVREWLSKSDKRSRARDGARASLGVVHRIDKETTGLVVFTRTWLAKQSLSSQFRAHTVHRRYLAIAHGDVQTRTIESHLIADRGDGLRGSLESARARRGGRGHDEEGQVAITHVERVAELGDAESRATLIGCRLETGRTHQIRIHSSEAGHPLLGERVYVRDFPGALIPAPRLMLHAAELGFVHPATERPMRWDDPMPSDMEGVMKRLLSRSRPRSPS